MDNGAADKQPEIKPLPRVRIGAIGMFLVLVIVVFVGWSGILLWQNRGLANDESRLTAELSRLESTEGQADSKASLATKQTFLAKREAGRVLWTNVINRLFATNPQSVTDEEGKSENLVVYQALSGNKDGNLSLSVKTRSGSADAYVDTAILLREFGRRTYYRDIFIPSLATVFNQLGQTQLSYTMSLLYAPEEDPQDGLIGKEELVVKSPLTVDPQAEATNPDLRARIDALRAAAGEDSSESSTTTETANPVTPAENGR